MDPPTNAAPADLVPLRSDSTPDANPAVADPSASATLADVEQAIARHMRPLRDEVARLQRQIEYLRLGPDPW